MKGDTEPPRGTFGENVEWSNLQFSEKTHEFTPPHQEQ